MNWEIKKQFIAPDQARTAEEIFSWNGFVRLGVEVFLDVVVNTLFEGLQVTLIDVFWISD